MAIWLWMVRTRLCSWTMTLVTRSLSCPCCSYFLIWEIFRDSGYHHTPSYLVASTCDMSQSLQEHHNNFYLPLTVRLFERLQNIHCRPILWSIRSEPAHETSVVISFYPLHGPVEFNLWWRHPSYSGINICFRLEPHSAVLVLGFWIMVFCRLQYDLFMPAQ